MQIIQCFVCGPFSTILLGFLHKRGDTEVTSGATLFLSQSAPWVHLYRDKSPAAVLAHLYV